MLPNTRKKLSQNFLYSRKLVRELVAHSGIGIGDTVLEIGPGKGIITEALVEKAQTVIAVELDPHWHQHLQDKFKNTANFTLYRQDILKFKLPKRPYTVFANLPFAIEGQIIRHLIEGPNPPKDSYLIIDAKLAHRLIAANIQNQFSVLHQPWFDFTIFHRFRPTDFEPVPNVQPVMLQIKLKESPLLPLSDRRKWTEFILAGFAQGDLLHHNLEKIYPFNTVSKAMQELSQTKKFKPSHLTLSQWLRLYQKLTDTN